MYMTIEFDSNQVLSKKEREERVLDLHFNQNKNYRQIAPVDQLVCEVITKVSVNNLHKHHTKYYQSAAI
jgi:hypothetical protein